MYIYFSSIWKIIFEQLSCMSFLYTDIVPCFPLATFLLCRSIKILFLRPTIARESLQNSTGLHVSCKSVIAQLYSRDFPL